MLYTSAEFIRYLSHFSYLGIATFFGSVSYFVPVPEEINLMFLGYLVGLGKFNFWLAFLSAFAGIWIVDSLFYLLAYKESDYLLRVKQKISGKTLLKYERIMEKNLGKALLISKFIIGFRFIGSLLAGSLKVKWKQFFIFNSLVIAVYVGGFMAIGWYFEHRLFKIINLVEGFRSLFLSLLFIVIIVIIFTSFAKKTESEI